MANNNSSGVGESVPSNSIALRSSVEYDAYFWSRRIALFVGILLSGGMLVLPRLPLLVLLIGFSLAATGWRGISLANARKIWILLAAIAFAAVIRPGPFDIESLAVRYANFFGGVCLLAAYLKSGFSMLPKDLFAFMPWMAIQAIVTFLLANGLPSIFSLVELPDEGSFWTFLFVFNYHVLIEDFSGWHRPNGFFWEPGVFQMYINLYLYLALFIFEKRQHVVLAVLAVICVYSTTGVLIAGLLLAAAFLKRLTAESRRKLLPVIVAVIFLAPVFGYLAVKNIEDKLTGESQGSALIRQYDFLVGWGVIAEHPLLGIGFDHKRYKEIAPHLSSAQDILGLKDTPDRSTSNGILYLGYTLGIPLALVFIWGLFRQKIFSNTWVMGVILLLSMIGEALIFTPFLLMIVFSAFVSTHTRRAS